MQKSLKNLKLAYVIWLDATHGLDEIGTGVAGLAELHEVGFVWAENEHEITLTLEHQEDAEKTRIWLNIPRSGIKSIQYFTLGQLSRMGRKRKVKDETEPKSPGSD